jgi:hypothetical protein
LKKFLGKKTHRIESSRLYQKIVVALPLHHPSQELLDIYEHSAIVAVRDASYFFAGVVGIMFVPRAVIWMAREFCTINVVELDDLSSGLHLTGDMFSNTI